MAQPATLGALRDLLLELHQRARAIGEHQVSYHVLCAVHHAADSLGEMATLETRLKSEMRMAKQKGRP